MAGTLTYGLQVAHTFQRKFDPESLAAALADCHIYLISRRPSVRIKKGSARIHLDRLSVEFLARDHARSPISEVPISINLQTRDAISDFRTYVDGSYFSLIAGRTLIHGDAWSLASIMSGAREGLARQEVMYIGQAFGQDGSRNVIERTTRHEKLQRVYEVHAGSAWDIFVTAIRITEVMMEADDHIDDTEPGFDLDRFYEVFQDAVDGRLLKPSIDLVEHGLIAYFNPPYNKNLLEWKAAQPTNDMRKMGEAGFRLLRLHLTSDGSLARFYSREVQEPRRAHLVLHDLPPAPNDRVVRGISAPQVDGWRAEFYLFEGQDQLSSDAEKADLALNVFGPLSPKIRVPEEVEPQIAELEKTFRRWASESSEPIAYEGPEFLHDVGSIPFGIDPKGNKVLWQVHKPGTGMLHGLVVGGRNTGKTNFLNVLRLGARSSGKISLLSADPTGRNLAKDISPVAGYPVAQTLPDITTMLGQLKKELDRRITESGYVDPSPAKPGLIITIEDAHLVFSESNEALEYAEALAEFGPENGICMICTMPDLNLQRFGGSSALRNNFALRGTISFYGDPAALDMLDELDDEVRARILKL
jgi:hypothetical protein